MPHVALTFDDGPGPWTEAILDVLAAHGATATFFVIGSLAERDPDTLRRMLDEGHEIGNHTWSHPLLARDCDDTTVHRELERTNDVLAELTGSHPRRFRAPRYDVDARVLGIAEGLGLTHTRGDVRPPDWDTRCTAAFITTFVVRQVGDRAIIGLHDGIAPNDAHPGASRQATADAVARIVPRLAERGFELVTAGTLLDSEQRG